MSNHRIRPSPADLVTAANALCGFAAIVVIARAFAGEPTGSGVPDTPLVVAAGLIILGAALDSVDGVVARRFGGSPLGEHLEVMSDALTFGLAPAVLFAVDAAGYSSPWDVLAIVVGGAYVLAALMRLARYAVLSADSSSDHDLTGFPSPPAAMAMLAIVGVGAPPAASVGLVALIAVLMTGTFRFPVLTGFAARFMIGWFVFGFIAIATLPPWVPALATLLIFAGVFALLSRQRLP